MPEVFEDTDTRAQRLVETSTSNSANTFVPETDPPDPSDDLPLTIIDAVQRSQAIESSIGSSSSGGGGPSLLKTVEKMAEHQAEKGVLKRVANWGVEKLGWEGGKKLLQRFGWRAAEKVVEGEGEVILEGAGEAALEGTAVAGAEAAAVTGAEAVAVTGAEAVAATGAGAAVTAVAVPVAIGVAIGTVITAPIAYRAYKADKELNTQLDESSKAWRREISGVSTQETLIGRYVGLTSSLVNTLPQMQNKGQLDLRVSNSGSGMVMNTRLNGNTLSDDKGHTLDLSDPKVLNEFQGIIDQKIAAQEKIRDANDSKYLPDWMRIFSGDEVQKKSDAKLALAPLYRARAELDQYRKDIAAHPPVQHVSAPAAIPAAPAHAHGHDYSNLQAGSAATYVVGDSLALGAGNTLSGNVVNLAVERSHITTQAGLPGATEQLDYVMSHYHAGDKLFLHTGWNDAGSANSAAYKGKLDLLAGQAQFLKEHGVDVIWVVPAATSNEHSKQVKSDVRSQVEAMAKVQTEVAAAHGIKVVSKPADYISNDGIHPNSSAQYEAWARTITQGTGVSVGPGYRFNPSQEMVASNAPHPTPGNNLIHERSVALGEQLELHKLEQKYGLPSGLMLAIMDTECRGDPQIVNGQRLSAAGACGAFQFMPGTAQQYGIDPKDPHQSADGAARMLSDLNKKYHGDVAKIAAAYNWGTGNLDKQGLANAPQETVNYMAWVKSKMGIGEPPTQTQILAARSRAPIRNVIDHPIPSGEIKTARLEEPAPTRHAPQPHAVLLHENAG